jgi:hypothetical protein
MLNLPAQLGDLLLLQVNFPFEQECTPWAYPVIPLD